MKCPVCESTETVVIDSRPRDKRVFRRRECTRCLSRFSTFEVVNPESIDMDLVTLVSEGKRIE